MQPHKNSAPGLGENIFVVVALFLFTGGLLYVLREGSSDAVDKFTGDRLSQSVFAGIYAITLLLSGLRLKRFASVSTTGGMFWIWILVGLALVSVLWSVAPQVTLRRSLALTAAALFGIYLAARYTLRQQLVLLAWALGIAAIMSLVFALLVPSIGVMVGEYAGSWRGIYVNKNILGRVMSLSVLVFLLLARDSRRHRWLWRIGAGLSALLLLASNSVTSWVVTALILVVSPIQTAFRRSLLLTVLLLDIIALAVIVGALFFNDLETAAASLGRDVTLTGRTRLWSLVFYMIDRRPLFGYGYGGFWLGPESTAALVGRIGDWAPPHAHNGYLDIWLDLGLVGLSLFVLGIVATLFRSLAWLRHSRTASDFWPLQYAVFILAFSFTESVIRGTNTNNIYWVLYVATVASLATFHVRRPTTQAAIHAPYPGRRAELTDA